MNYQINLTNIDKEIVAPVFEILTEVGIAVSDTADLYLTVEKSDALTVSRSGNTVIITYTRKNEIFRGISYLPRFLEDGIEINESPKYSLLSYMADASRNAVPNLKSAKQLIRYLAMMGYNSMMLYTEDTFELPDYKYFGHMRGRYTEAELRELDDYAFSFGIELIPCVQTLAHLCTALRWPDFDGYKDNWDILMVGDDRTYKFVRAVLEQAKRCFRSRRINIGMDEAVALGRGDYLKKNGYKEPSEIMLEHLDRVADICRELGLHPMMWSDMFFRMSFGGSYYVNEGEIPSEVVEKVPADVDQIYWDYYTIDPKRAEHMLELHKKFKCDTVFAGGARKWDGFASNNRFTLNSTKMQLDKCEDYGVDQIIVTAWGDDGAEASMFSPMPTTLYFAERCYHKSPDEAHMESRSLDCFGLPFMDLLCFDYPNMHEETSLKVNVRVTNPAKYLLYNDPLERLYDRHMARETVSESYRRSAEKLLSLADNERFGYIFKTLGILCEILTVKADLGWRIYEAYGKGDKDALEGILNYDLPFVLAKLSDFIDTFRAQWYKESKTFGFSQQEIRLGGLMARLDSVMLRLEAYLSGEIDRIEELEYESLPVIPSQDGKYINANHWRTNVSAGVL